MWIRVIVVLLAIITNKTFAETQDLDIVFRERSHSDWKDVWHRERHTRCRETLIKHLFWACEKDIYRVSRRSSSVMSPVNFPWILESDGRNFLRSRRRMGGRSGSSITSECCSTTGCTWEEYAEYCPTNKRYTKYV